MYVTSIRMWKSSAQKITAMNFTFLLGGRRDFVVFVKNIPRFGKLPPIHLSLTVD